ncbi:HK97 family phage prohead protease [Kocuria palustris]|uniref:HK97 family phage prohead protease n=1 Tax=Kocuria palustris TaxID=71999 RepID=UPI0024684A59|nr:HK97 family phage prohead protease [Kocuria palustris]MDH5151812.1 HK97 family phage prohead protease [Kocuria palustris]
MAPPYPNPPDATRRVVQCKAAVSTDQDAPDLTDGQFRAVVAVFDNVDSHGDVVVRGAFAETLNEWADRGDEIPVIWSHDWADPFSHIGTVKSATETDRGLEIVGEIPQEDRDSNPRAAQVYRLLKSRRITQFSFAFDVLDGAEVERDGRRVTLLRRLKLHEVGPCLLGVNQSTELGAIKSDNTPPVTGTPTKENTMSNTQIPNVYAEQKAAELKAAHRIASAAEKEDRDLTSDEQTQLNAHLKAAAEHGAKSERQLENARNFEAIGAALKGVPAEDLGRDGLKGHDQDDDGHRSAGDRVRPSFETAAGRFGTAAAKALTGRGALPGRVRVPGLLPAGKAAGLGLGGDDRGAQLLGGSQAFDRLQPSVARRGIVDLVEVIAPSANGGVTSPHYSFLTEEAHENLSAVVESGAKKPTSTYRMVERAGKQKFVATLTEPFAKSLLDDYSQLRPFLASRLAEDLYEAIDTELMYGDGGAAHLLGLANVEGVRRVAWDQSLPRTLRKARTSLATTRDQPTAWFVHPEDAAEIDLYTDAQGRPVDLRNIMGGLPIVETPGAPQGMAVLADFGRAAVFTDNAVEITVTDAAPHYASDGTVDGTLWEHNEVALRAEVRIGGLAVTRPSAFAFVALNADAKLPKA